MGHYDEFYEAKYEEDRKRALKWEDRPLEGRVESVRFDDEGALVCVRVPVEYDPRRHRLLKLFGTHITIPEAARSGSEGGRE